MFQKQTSVSHSAAANQLSIHGAVPSWFEDLAQLFPNQTQRSLGNPLRGWTIISDSVELWDTDVCFLHPTNVSIPNYYRIRIYFVWCLTENGRIIRCVAFIEQYQITKKQARSCLWDPEMDRTSKPNQRKTETLINGCMRTVVTNAHSSQGESQLYIFEDNVAVVKMIIKGRRPTMIHVSRTHRVALDWLFDRINLQPKIQIQYVDTKNQLVWTAGNFNLNEWRLSSSYC